MPITVKHTKVSTIPDDADTSLVRPSDWNADHTLVGLGTMAEQNSNNISVTGGTMTGVAITGYIPTTQKGVANGVATLDAGGKVPVSELPAAVLGALSYQGTWDANTNSPTLTSSVGTKGYYYVVSVAGNTNLNGITDWLVGDWAVFNGSIWQKVDNTETVTSVNGQTGAVVLTTTNIAEGTNLYYTDARARGAISAGTGISYNSTTGVITNASPSLGGDVVGPASATDNAVARYDTTTGKLLQNSLVIIDDTGSVTGVNALTAESLTVNNNATLGSSNSDTLEVNARITTDLEPNTDAAKDIGTSGRNWRDGFFSRNLQAEGKVVSPHFDALNSAGGQLRNSGGTAQLQWGGGGGNNVSVDVAININPANAQVDLSPTGTGTVRINPATAGTMNNMVIGGTTPLAITGTTITATSFVGSGASLTNVVNSLAASTGISVSGSTGAVTVTNTAPDQTVALASGTGISVTGTYPNFTVTNTAPSSGGTVTSVTGTAPVVSSGGNTPAISMAAANGSTNGYLTSTDWTTFNGKGTGTVTSVAASVPSFLSVSGSPITTSGTLAISYSGTALPVANGGTGITTTPTNGQIPIGNGTNYTAAAITAGTNIAVTNGSGSISIATNIPAPQITVYTSGSGTYTVPANTKYLTVRMVGGGGSGGASGGTTAGGGGGAGGYLEGIITSLSSTYSYAVGAGGGNTTFGSSLFTANAGSDGTSSSATASGGAGGSASGGSVNATGATGGFGWASVPYFNGGMGAASPFGAGGSGGGTGFGNGFAAVSYGSGGGGAVGGGGAGAGGAGVIIVTAYF